MFTEVMMQKKNLFQYAVFLFNIHSHYMGKHINEGLKENISLKTGTW
jgi:hypothetical protein